MVTSMSLAPTASFHSRVLHQLSYLLVHTVGWLVGRRVSPRDVGLVVGDSVGCLVGYGVTGARVGLGVGCAVGE